MKPVQRSAFRLPKCSNRLNMSHVTHVQEKPKGPPPHTATRDSSRLRPHLGTFHGITQLLCIAQSQAGCRPANGTTQGA